MRIESTRLILHNTQMLIHNLVISSLIFMRAPCLKFYLGETLCTCTVGISKYCCMTSSIVVCISTCTLAVVKLESYDHLCSEVVGYSAMRIQRVQGTLHTMYMYAYYMYMYMYIIRYIREYKYPSITSTCTLLSEFLNSST